ncbi:MAG TPA: hypothetical protein VEI57_05720 [Nitrospirota bacterium]|nr:hypothetical protein [Nitrospirota bacterium]
MVPEMPREPEDAGLDRSPPAMERRFIMRNAVTSYNFLDIRTKLI